MAHTHEKDGTLDIVDLTNANVIVTNVGAPGSENRRVVLYSWKVDRFDNIEAVEVFLDESDVSALWAHLTRFMGEEGTLPLQCIQKALEVLRAGLDRALERQGTDPLRNVVRNSIEILERKTP